MIYQRAQTPLGVSTFDGTFAELVDRLDHPPMSKRMEVDGETNRLSIDGRAVGECRTSAALLRQLAESPVHVGFACFDTYVAVDYVRVAHSGGS